MGKFKKIAKIAIVIILVLLTLRGISILSQLHGFQEINEEIDKDDLESDKID